MLAMVVGCASSALTNSSPANPPRSAAPSGGGAGGSGGGSAVTGAVTKLNLISQDGCQTRPPELVYPVCDRFLAELRSAAGTVRNGADGLPNAAAVQASATGILTAADKFDRDGCGSGPYASSSDNAPTCAADLRQVRAGLAALLEQTRPHAGG